MFTLNDLFIKIKTEKLYLMSPQMFIYVVRHQYLFSISVVDTKKKEIRSLEIQKLV